MNGIAIIGGGSVGTPDAGFVVRAIGDVNGDSKADIVLQHKDTGEIYVWQMNGNAIIGGGPVGTPDPGWLVKVTGDFNSDGKADIGLQNENTGQIWAFEMNGNTVIGGGNVGTPDQGWYIPTQWISCRQGSAYADGCADAFGAAPQYPNLVSSFQTRPAWNVAGVDYYVGYPPGQTFTDWQTALNGSYGGGSWQLNATSTQCTSGGHVVISGIDFTSARNGATGNIYIPAEGCSSLTIQNSKVGCVPGAGGMGWFIHAQNPNVIVVFENNTVDYSPCTPVGANVSSGTAAPSQSVITASGAGIQVTMQYNWLSHYCDHALEITDQAASIDVRYNLYDDPNRCAFANAPMSWTQGGGSNTVLIAYNTAYLYESAASGNQGFEIYSSTGGQIYGTPLEISHNTIVDTQGELCYVMHGTTASDHPTHIVGTPGEAINSDNYFALAALNCGTLGVTPFAFYPNSFGKLPGDSVGWVNMGNIDMITGKTITP